ncbi:MAG: WecB/TagA/CpsF family glycosyltransferase, partial [Paludibacteraceae bacterium]|nr:WecB/TagA/CpsF family glycosyltransferase [Paludibacteraceae bacterium]
DKLRKDYPGINIVGYRNGYIKTDEERNALIADVAEKKPDVVFVAMGSPKQELLMMDMEAQHPAIYQGLGGSYDVYTGHVKRAPAWWQNHNLEWLYRLINQPSRIKRQIKLLEFVWNVKTGRY